MVTKKAIIDNELIREIVAIRLDTLWRMLGLNEDGFLPGKNDEGATGKFDNKGAIFTPGGLIYQDVDEQFIPYSPYGQIDGESFRKKIRESMRYDNATLLYPDGIANGINLDGGFFSKAARRIFTYKRAAHRRKMKIGNSAPIEISADDIIRSHCPIYMKPPYGARTRISSCLSVGLINPPLFFAYYKAEFNFSREQTQIFTRDLDRAREKPVSSDGKCLYPPYIVVCHDTRYKENNFTGLTRIVGIGKFGEFATISFEAITPPLLKEMKRRKIKLRPEDVFAEYGDLTILGILRVYCQTNPGRRSLKYNLYTIMPKEDIGLNVGKIAAEAQKRYNIKRKRKKH
ncbi:hypothetical protein [Desulfopila inferna]|uniref:hypothetical protein n=1 Tax=Desulfopila inferna TaxID=468528 RepID=UPI001962A775|nr:hypothetical protein [Desulfopila inferna]MBM9604023.1 hypothetical protein [Desulfopila inferna]